MAKMDRSTTCLLYPDSVLIAFKCFFRLMSLSLLTVMDIIRTETSILPLLCSLDIGSTVLNQVFPEVIICLG